MRDEVEKRVAALRQQQSSTNDASIAWQPTVLGTMTAGIGAQSVFHSLAIMLLGEFFESQMSCHFFMCTSYVYI
jgi:hypothetical protein